MAEKVVAYATADHHVPEEANVGAWKALAGVSGDSLFALAQVVTLCVRDHVPLLAAGDLVDGPDVEPDALTDWFSVLRPLQASRLPILYCGGNHERGRDWLAAFGPSAVRLDGRVVTIDSGHTVSGHSYVPNDRFADAVAGMGRITDIGLYHQAIAELCGGRGIPCTAFPPHRLAVVGDTHVATTIEPATGPRLVLSTGPLAPQSVAEFGQDGVWAVHADLTVRRVDLKSRKYLSFTVDSPVSAESCLTTCATIGPDPHLPDNVARPLVAVRITGEVEGFVPAIRDLAKARDFALRVLDSGTTIPATTGDRPVVVGMDLKTAAARRFPNDPASRRLAEELAVPGADPVSVLSKARAAYEVEADHATETPDGDARHVFDSSEDPADY